MGYQLEQVDGKFNLYSPKINRNVMEAATLDEIKIAIAIEMEYATKLQIVKLCMTFPHGFATTDDQIIVHEKALEAYEAWFKEIHKRIGFLDEYYALIDAQINHILG